MTPSALKTYLNSLITHQLYLSTMIWGAPGIGKSSIVSQVAKANNLDFIDLRLSQLAPTDLRGLPVAVPDEDDTQKGISTWYPPEFLPRKGKGILFLDELNMAPPVMQGVAQQLILDRRVGSYQVPEDWFIWAAGNRKEDRASVFEMPAPLANRFLHLSVEPDFDSFKLYAFDGNIDEQIVSFLAYRTPLLHKFDPQQSSWPSPRSWEMANHLHRAKIDIAPAVGEGAAAEFNAFVSLYRNLPNLEAILQEKGTAIAFPDEPSIRYATTIGLAMRANDVKEFYHAFTWLVKKATAEWVQLYAVDMMRQMRSKGQIGALAVLIKQDAKLQKFFKDYQDLL
ncbi:ATPase [Aphanothece hegewaldii CCALA 016]|uniref:ATPase n=1 Tax=Aphanothece hegewaldii CCALA 016 TaxID=2107694 RepID=A0A2T1LVW8_9CHRO|nr:MoxR family ATPase [Aphanothece hegewaldii]PSF36008.1 ATPase [Aphanothece hegewaldii CCALA 016]